MNYSRQLSEIIQSRFGFSKSPVYVHVSATVFRIPYSELDTIGKQFPVMKAELELLKAKIDVECDCATFAERRQQIDANTPERLKFASALLDCPNQVVIVNDDQAQECVVFIEPA